MEAEHGPERNRFGFSDRELAVLLGVMRGDRDREIAAQLGVSPAVVRQCGVALRKKMRARSRTELAIRGVQFGFLAYLS